MLAAASPVLTRRREGSSPSGPTCCLTIWLCSIGVHDVTAACCLARAEVRVQLPLGALFRDRWSRLYKLRWSPCWYGQAPVKRPYAGSIPAAAAFDCRLGIADCGFGEPENGSRVGISHTPGQLLLVVTPGSEPGRRWFDSNPRNLKRSRSRKTSEVENVAEVVRLRSVRTLTSSATD